MSDRKELQKSLRTDFSPNLRVRLSRGRFRLRQAAHMPGMLAGGRLDKPIFVIGAPRSGTSLLFKVLMSSSHVANWPGEAHEVWERDHHPALRGWESNVLTGEDLTEEQAARIRREFYLVTGGRRHLIDKTPRNTLRVGFVEALFPDALYVFLQRDGRENINSLINAWRTPRYRTYKLPEPHAIPGIPDPTWWKFVLYPGWRHDKEGPLEVVCAQQWVHSNESALASFGEIPRHRWTTVRYEELIENPIEEVARLVEFLGLPYEARMRSEAAAVKTKPVNVVTPPERGKWRKENPREVEAITSLIAPTMAKLGYSAD